MLDYLITVIMRQVEKISYELDSQSVDSLSVRNCKSPLNLLIIIRALHPHLNSDHPQNVMNMSLAREIICLWEARSHFVTLVHLCTKPPKPIVAILHSFIK